MADLEALVEQCTKSNDVDVKISATNKLQAEFEAGVQIIDPDIVINALKTCLRTSNQQLSGAVLAAIPPFLPLVVLRSHGVTPPVAARPASASTSTSSTAASLKGDGLIDVVTLRQIMHAFLPTGGVIERLGDSREKTRDKAREALVLLGGFAFRCGAGGGSTLSSKSGKTIETPMSLFEKCIREGGLSSKVWRIREQAILTLVHIRRAHHQFPLKPYLPSLVATLEDTDAHVRDCSRLSIVELFTGPAVSDGARADLKKEMAKKGVRKAIADGVEAKLMSGSVSSYPASGGSEAGDSKKEYQPPSMSLMGRKPSSSGTPTAGPSVVKHTPLSRTTSRAIPSRPASSAANLDEHPAAPVDSSLEVKTVYIASSRDLESEFADMVKAHDGKENEFNWADRERAVMRVRGMLKGDVHVRYPDTFLACLKDNYIHLSLKALNSLRTTVSSNACLLYSELAVALGTSFDPFCETLYIPLLKMAGFTKKIAASQSQATVTTLITHCSPQPRMVLPLLWSSLQEKTVAARAFIVGHLRAYVEIHAGRFKHSIESSGGADILEKSMKRSLADPNPAVREQARSAYWVLEAVWPDRGRVIMDSLDPVARKQLEKTCPNPDVAAAAVVAPKNVKKSSVAAAIAASRAKAKAIATAPPSLRHQATSTSHAVRATSPQSKARPTSPITAKTRPASPSSPKSRSVMNTVQRSSSAGAVPTSPPHKASPPSPPSPTASMNVKRRTSSPLAPTLSSSTSTPSSTLRRAAQTALPSSPPTPSRTTLVRPSPASYRSTPTMTTPRKSMPVPVNMRENSLAGFYGDDGSLLLATAIPIPDDSDSDVDESVNLMSFSAPFELYRAPQAPRSSRSQPQSFSPKSNDSRNATLSNALSTGSGSAAEGQPVVEDALRARAEQAESAAERLLELVDPDEEESHHSSIPASLLNGSTTATPKPRSSVPSAIRTAHPAVPVTPINKNAAILKQAALFQNSPAYSGTSAAPASLMDMMKEKKNESGWWLKRVALIERRARGEVLSSAHQELLAHVSALEDGSADVGTLKQMAIICANHRVDEAMSPMGHEIALPSSPSPFNPFNHTTQLGYTDFWVEDKTFDKTLNALIKFLQPSLGPEELEYGLIVLWEMLENQSPYIEGREGDVFDILLNVRYSNKFEVLEATNTVRDALTTQIEPVYGLTTMHASLRSFQTAAAPESSSVEVKAATYAFGLIALGKFILRLPEEVLDEELPRLKNTFISALNDKTSLVVRESAASSIIAAQLVLRDETHLFSLLDGLADEKKNLLTYLFDKHGARGLQKSRNGSGTGAGVATSVDKLRKEMQRLDTRTSTPPRPTR